MSKYNGDLPAMAQGNLDTLGKLKPEELKSVFKVFGGLTKREHFAGLAMQGLLVNVGRNGLDFGDVHGESIRQADLLLKALEETK